MSGRDTSCPARYMSVRDYFMAHAPAKPPKWFLPVMPPCVAVPSVNAIEDADLRVEVTMCMECDSDPTSPAAIEWFAARDAAEQAQAAWQTEFRKQLCFQWPAAWAHEMLKQRLA